MESCQSVSRSHPGLGFKLVKMPSSESRRACFANFKLKVHQAPIDVPEQATLTVLIMIVSRVGDV